MPDQDVLWEKAAEILAGGDDVRIRLTGKSMFPNIRPGDLAVITSVNFEDVIPGDIIAYAVKEKYLLHRVISREGEWLICKGDSLKRPDPPISHEYVIGKAVRIERGDMIRNLDDRTEKKRALRILKYPFLYYLKAIVRLKLRV